VLTAVPHLVGKRDDADDDGDRQASRDDNRDS
jgi:hypothetical protein